VDFRLSLAGCLCSRSSAPFAGATRDELRSVERTAGEMGLADLLAEVLDEPDEIGV
jgi:hypothetical protein